MDALDDIRFLVGSANRVEALSALREAPRNRDELEGLTGASGPTVGRLLNDFETRGWVVRDGHEYEVTKPGAYVAAHFSTLYERMNTERRLRDVWDWLPGELPEFSLEMVADATVTTVEPGDPYAPANRCAALYEETDSLRGFDAALTAPHHFEELYTQIVDGMETEIIFPPAVSKNIASTYPDIAGEVLQSDSFTLWLSDSLPLYKLLIFDERVGIGGYDPESGVLQAFVDTDSPETRTWCQSTFDEFRSDAWSPTHERAPSQSGGT